ncbi:MAG: YitT family protein [Clostridia bacterium]
MKKTDLKGKFTKETVKGGAIDMLFWIAGCSCYAFSTAMFTAPNHIAAGGATGLAIVLNYVVPQIQIGTWSFIINIPLFILAWRVIGLKFIFRSAIVTAMLSLIIDLFSLFIPAYTGNPLLAVVFGGVCNGTGLALIFLRGATSGGSDILARVLRTKIQYIPMGRMILFIDCIVILISGFVFKSLESVLYALIVVFISSKTIDSILYRTGSGKLLMVVTDNARKMSDAITSEMHRGVTLLPVRGGYTGKEKSMLIIAVRNNQVSTAYRIIHEFEPKPFIIISDAGEILGEGFKRSLD